MLLPYMLLPTALAATTQHACQRRKRREETGKTGLVPQADVTARALWAPCLILIPHSIPDADGDCPFLQEFSLRRLALYRAGRW